MFFVAPRLQVHHVVGGRVDTEVVAGQDLLPAFCLAFLKGGKGDGGGARPMSTSSAWLGLKGLNKCCRVIPLRVLYRQDILC